MKKFRTLAALLLIALMTTALAACGGSSAGVKKGEEFSVGEYNMMYDSAAVSGSEASVTVLLKGKTGLPVAFNNGNMSIIINARLGEGDSAIKASKLSAEGIKDNVTEDEYGAKITYTFENVSDADYQTATIYLTDDESQLAVLDFKSGLGEASSSGGASTGLIIAIVVAALGVAGGIFAAKKGFFKKDPGTGMPPAMGEPVTGQAAPGAVPAAAPVAAPAVTPVAPEAVTPAAAPAAPASTAPTIRLDLDDAPIPAAAPAVEPAPAVTPAAAPVTPAAEPAPAPTPAPEPVTFVENVKGDDGVSTYEVYKGPDKASAIAFLKTKTVDQENYFIVVDTPEGNFGRDIQGLYQE